MSIWRPTSHFKVLQKLDPDYAQASITKYESTRTGLRVVVVDQKGPIVDGRFSIATEIHDDSGAPHTLEHLCFMGSRNYRYKGLLDKLAARAYSRTNAFTSTEQTQYELRTAGWAGFAQILPVYLEHLIVPTLTDAGCYTEVHHVDGKGKDAGVVYAEMQGVQNDQAELMALQAARSMYPEGSGFRSETGGLMENLRNLSPDRIRGFHKAMYEPKNMCLILAGEVDHRHLLRILDEFEESILDIVPPVESGFQRPWTESKPMPPISETIVERVKFPDEDEDTGSIMIGYLGPRYDEYVAYTALYTLLYYLCGSSITILSNTLVEKEQLCGSVDYSLETRPDTVVWFHLESVETDLLDQTERRLHGLLAETAAKSLDIAFLQHCLRITRRTIKLQSEDPSEFFSESVAEDHLFGRRDGTDLKHLASLEEYDVLEGWSEQQWREFLTKWLVEAKHITIIGEPSNELSKAIRRDEEARIQKRAEKLGDKGLAELAQKLEYARAENEQSIPDSLLEKFPVPSVESVHFISTTTARAGRAKDMGRLANDVQKIVDKDDHNIPLFLHFEQYPSNFVGVQLCMCTGLLPTQLKPLLPLYLNNVFATPIDLDGRTTKFEDVVLKLQTDCATFDANLHAYNNEMLALTFTIEPEKYGTVIALLRNLIYGAIHDPERLKASLSKILAAVPDDKRDGSYMALSVNNLIRFKPESSVRAQNTLVRAIYLRRVKQLLRSDPDEVVHRFAKLCETLHRPENFRILVSGAIDKLERPVYPWKALIQDHDTSKTPEPIDDRLALLSDAGRSPGSAAYIIPMSAITSSYALLTTQCPPGYDHPDIAALYVAVVLLNAVEGPLWVAVRGTGLAYNSAFRREPSTGALIFDIYRSTDAQKAFHVSKEQIEGIASGAIAVDKFALEGAISEIVLNMAEEQRVFAEAASLSYANQVIRGIGKDHSVRLLLQAQAVTVNDVRRVVKEYMLPCFRPQTSNVVITCAPTMTDALCEGFAAVGYKPEVRTLDAFQDGYGLEVDADAGAESDDFDDDDADDVDGDDYDDDESGTDGEEMIG